MSMTSYPPPAPVSKKNGSHSSRNKDGLPDAPRTPRADNEQLEPASPYTSELRRTLRALTAGQALVELSVDGFMRHVSGTFAQLAGFGEGELTGKHFSTLLDQAMFVRPEYRELWADLTAGRSRTDVLKLFAKHGRELTVRASFHPVLDEEQSPCKVIVLFQDVTDTISREGDARAQVAALRAELDAVLEREKVSGRAAAVVECVPAAAVFADARGVVQFVNGAARKLFKWLEPHLSVRADSLVGANISMLVRGAENALFSDNGRPVIVKAGSESVRIVASAAYDAEGRQMGSITLWEVMTERLEASQTASHYAQSLAAASEELSAVARQMTSNSEQTTNQASLVAQASEQVTSNVTSVAASAEEMSATVREIAKNAHDAAGVATLAVRAAEDTNRTVAQLGESSMEIGKVIKVITSIAQQTNLLALNATIEAARAGEAGKGFAVVANEVKELAKQTAAATEDISQKIETIQNDTKGAVGAIQHIGKIIGQINDFQNTIASAVEQQAATTNEIARNASEAARGSLQISGNIGAVSLAARNTSEGAANTQASAEELSRVASQLRTLLEGINL